MPTHKSIPERYPVLEHMEARMRAEGRLPHQRPAARRSTSWLGALALGGAGGAMLVVAFVAVVQGAP